MSLHVRETEHLYVSLFILYYIFLPTHPPTYLPRYENNMICWTFRKIRCPRPKADFWHFCLKVQTYYMSPRIPGLLSPFTTSIKGVLGSPVKHQLLYLTMFFNINVFIWWAAKLREITNEWICMMAWYQINISIYK